MRRRKLRPQRRRRKGQSLLQRTLGALTFVSHLFIYKTLQLTPPLSARPRGGPRDSRGNGPRREGQQPRREGRPPNSAVSGGARPGGQTQRYNNGPRRDGRPPSGMASGEARQGGGQGQRPNNGARPDNRRPQSQSRPRGGPANANSNSATRPNRDGRRGERQSDRAPRSDSKEELKALEAAQAEQVFAAAYDKLKQGKLFNVDLGNVEDIFHPTIKAPTKQSSVKSKDSRALAEQARLADLRERAGDYSRYVRRLHERTDVAALGPVGLADLVLSHRRGIVPAERDKAIDVVQKLVGSGKGTTVTV